MLATSDKESMLVFALSPSLQTGSGITYCQTLPFLKLRNMLSCKECPICFKMTDRVRFYVFPPPCRVLTFICCGLLDAVDAGDDGGEEEDGHHHGGDDNDHHELLLLDPRHSQR